MNQDTTNQSIDNQGLREKVKNLVILAGLGAISKASYEEDGLVGLPEDILNNDIDKLLDLIEQEKIKVLDDFTKDFNNYIASIPDKKKLELGYLEMTGMVWGVVACSKERVTQLKAKENK